MGTLEIAYEVSCKAHEEALQHCETDRYEVVRCDIRLNGATFQVPGLTFCYIDDEE